MASTASPIHRPAGRSPLDRAGAWFAALLVVAAAVAGLPPVAPAAAQSSPAAAPGERLAGPDRIATAVQLSQRGWDGADVAVLVRADAPADALSAGMLADELGAPLLLTRGDVLSSAVEAELRRLGVGRVVLVGGTAAVGAAVEQRVRDLGPVVERVAGPERFATAVAVSEAIAVRAGAPDPVLLARGAHREPARAWPDALAAGAFAALPETTPLLLAADALPGPTRARLAALAAPVTVVGGTAAVPGAVAEEVARVAPGVQRLAGADRYATSGAVAAAVLEALPDTPRPLLVASGADYPDALAAAALAGRIDGLLLLVPPAGASLASGTATWLRANQDRFSSLIAVGGAGALGDQILAAVAEASSTEAPPLASLPLPPVADMGPAWQRTFTIGYGEDESQFGLDPAGEGLLVGPEYGAQGPDGSWWFLDVAKLRVARFDAEGRYLEQHVLGPDLLTDGRYFQYQLPRVLADGTFVAFALTRDGNGTWVLRIKDGRADLVVLPRAVFVTADDGRLLYGMADTLDQQQPVAIDLDARTVTPVQAFRGRDGGRWWLSTRAGALRFSRPDQGQDRTLPVIAAEPPHGPVGFHVEVASDDSGNLHVLAVGVPLRDERQQLGGLTTIRPDGTLAPVEAIRNPYSPAEMGSPAHLGVRPGSDELWMMFVEPDGVHVYQRRV